MTDEQYEKLVDPATLLSIGEVHDFCLLSDDILDLEAFKDRCTEQELYEYCAIIQQRINKLQYDQNRPKLDNN